MAVILRGMALSIDFELSHIRPICRKDVIFTLAASRFVNLTFNDILFFLTDTDMGNQ